MKWLKETLSDWKEKGIPFWYAHDGSTGEPSITLFFAYTTFILTFASAILLHIFPDLLNASVYTLIFWVIAFVFYRLRKLDKIKIDLDDREIELEGSDDDDGKEKSS